MRMLLIGRGKMGTLIQQTAQAAGDEVVAALGREDLGKLASLDGVDVVIDFSRPETLDAVCAYVRRTKTPLLSGTTGYSPAQMATLESLGTVAPVLWSANFSLGIAVFVRALQAVTGVLRPDFDIEITETHHNQKADAPSGTAKLLLEALDPNDPESIDKRIFYTGILEVLEAIRDWGERLSAACARRAREEKDPVRKQELENMAAMMKRVPWGPATSFHDACETAWAVCFFLFVEGAGPSITWGRFDQYMYPYYKEDIEKGILTPEKAMELIEELYVRVTSNVWFQSTQMAYIFGGYYRYPHLDVGGLDENGRDASNELSYLCLRAMRYAKTTSPAVSLLLHQKTPDSLLYEACELAAEGMGHPSFFNCEGLYSMLEHRAGGLEGYSHYTRKDILKFGSPIGCVEPGAEGLQYGHTDSGIINVAGAALMAVTNGVMPEESDNMFAGKLLTFESGAPGSFQTFEAFYDAVKAQIKYAIDEAHANLLICEKLLAEQFNLPTFTVLLEGALEKGKDATAGGAKVNVGPTMNMCGFGTMVDSVAAIKKVVFEDRAATLEEVCAACMQNFVGYEDLRTKLQAAPKYGNDDDFADAIAADLWKWFSTCTMRLKMYRGHYCDAAVQMVQSNVGYGAMTGATPNGRLAGMPLSDTMSATQQADTHGPTAAARSYGKLDFPAYTNGTLLNMWISQSELIEQS